MNEKTGFFDRDRVGIVFSYLSVGPFLPGSDEGGKAIHGAA